MNDLNEKIKESIRQFNALPPEQQEAILREQRRGYVRAEMAMGSDRDEADYRAAFLRGDETTMARLNRESQARADHADAWLRRKGL